MFEVASDHEGIIIQVSDETIIANGVSTAVHITESGGAAQWRDSDFATDPTITAQDYALCFFCLGGLVGDAIYYDTGTANYSFNEPNLSPWPTPDVSGGLTFDENKKYCIYATYTASGGGGAVISPSRTLLGVGT
jgi:hypothetical protein